LRLSVCHVQAVHAGRRTDCSRTDWGHFHFPPPQPSANATQSALTSIPRPNRSAPQPNRPHNNPPPPKISPRNKSARTANPPRATKFRPATTGSGPPISNLTGRQALTASLRFPLDRRLPFN